MILKRNIGCSHVIGCSHAISCSHAIHMLKKTINNFVNNWSTVTLDCLDLSKAFDRCNHYGLLLELLEVKCHFNMLSNWFSKVSTQVIWENCLSVPVSLKCGLHQGSVLPPALFTLYVDNLLQYLESCNVGCYLGHRAVNSFMYADDIICLSISVTDIRQLFHLYISNI